MIPPMATVDTAARSSGHRRCRPTRCGGWPGTSARSGGGGASSRRGRATSASPAPTRSPTTRCRCCSAPTKSTGRSSACGCCTSRVDLHARPRGQPLRHRRPPGELPLARVELRRPDPAARRRPADDRRRLPRPRPGDHDAGLPPRAGRRRGGGDGGGGRGRRSPPAAPATVVDVYDWMRNLAMRIAMRALLGLDPDEAGKGAAAAEHFERALGYYGIDFQLRLLRGPGSPWRKLIASREVLDEIVFGEVARRRADPDPSRQRHPQPPGRRPRRGGRGLHRPRDPRPGDDPDVRRPRHLDLDPDLHAARAGAPPRGRWPGSARSRTGCWAARRPTVDQLEREMPYLEMVLDEVLRLYPPAWIGPRRAVREFEFGGYTVPRGAYVNYCSWASHRIPEVFPDPEAFIPERFTRERKAALPRGAYVPFGGGSRICIGKRFGQTEVKLVATMLLQRLRLDALPGRTMTIRQMPTLSPEGGLRMRVRAARAPRLGAAMRALVISDTHFGAWTGRDLLREEFFLERLAPPAGRHRRADLPRRPLRLPLRLGRRRGRRRRRAAAADRREDGRRAARLPRRQPRPPPRPPRRGGPAGDEAGERPPADRSRPGPASSANSSSGACPGSRSRSPTRPTASATSSAPTATTSTRTPASAARAATGC